VGEASQRIPLVIRDPRQPGRGKIDDVVRTIDLAPTLLDLAGLPVTTSMEGVSLAPCLTSNAPSCPSLDAFNETGIWIANIPGLPEKHLRYPDLLELMEVPNRESGTLAIKPEYRDITLAAKDRMIRHQQWKLVYQPLESGYVLKLFDVVNDPICQHDLSTQHTDVTNELWVKLHLFISASDCRSSELTIRRTMKDH
jgi:arylsulfatase A-like enzyme